MGPGNVIFEETGEIRVVAEDLGPTAKKSVPGVHRISTSTNIPVLEPHLRDPDQVPGQYTEGHAWAR